MSVGNPTGASPRGNGARPVRTVPQRDADPTRNLTPPARRTPETDEMKELAATRMRATSIWAGPLLRRAVAASFAKLNPRLVARNPVMFVVEVGAVITTFVTGQQLITGSGNVGFGLQI